MTADAGGSVLSSMRYTAFGETRYASGSTSTDYLYTGQREEAELGLYYYVARWYDPALGRFIQADSVVPNPGNPMDWDRYAYVRNNPVNYTDPSGHALSCPDGDICGSISTPPPDEYQIPTIALLPVNPDNIEWIQWFGGTESAYMDHENYSHGLPNYNYDGYYQGYHCGLDLGARWSTSVRAGTYGRVIAASKKNGGYYAVVEYGDYQISYEALDGLFSVEIGQWVTPNSIIGGVGNHSADSFAGNTHLHMEVRYSSTGNGEYKDRIANPLLFMDLGLYEQLKSKVPLSPPQNVNFHTDEKDPLKQQNPIVRGGPVLWR